MGNGSTGERDEMLTLIPLLRGVDDCDVILTQTTNRIRQMYGGLLPAYSAELER